MALPEEVERLRDELMSLYADASRSVDRQLADLLADPIRTAAHRQRLLQRLREVRREVDRLTRDVDRQARLWLSTRFPAVYQQGAFDAALTGGAPFTWTQTQVEAVTELARATLDDLLAATRFMRRDAKALVRLAVREAALLDLVEGATVQRAARRLARVLQDHGIRAVRYSNGARHTLGDYADMSLRSVTALAYNRGTLNQLAAAGVRYVEVVDGAGCGWVSHDDVDLANGSIRTLADAAAHTIAHPRCARSFSGRPDLRARRQAEQGARFSPEEQQRRAVEERARETTQRIQRRRTRRQARTRAR